VPPARAAPVGGEPDSCQSACSPRRCRESSPGPFSPPCLCGKRRPPQPSHHTHERARRAAEAQLLAEGGGSGCRGRAEPGLGTGVSPVRPRLLLQQPRAGRAGSHSCARQQPRQTRWDRCFPPLSLLFLKQTLLVPPPRTETGGAGAAPARAQGPPRRRCEAAGPGWVCSASPPSPRPGPGQRAPRGEAVAGAVCVPGVIAAASRLSSARVRAPEHPRVFGERNVVVPDPLPIYSHSPHQRRYTRLVRSGTRGRPPRGLRHLKLKLRVI